MNDLARAGLGLFVAFAAHDAEELLTMAPSSSRVLSALPVWLPIPEELKTRGISQTHANLSIGIMTAFVAAAAADGVRTRGRSAWFRGGLLAFGTHGFTHLASTLAARRYTTGVLTAPTIVIPFWQWARRVLRRNGIRSRDPRSTAVAISAFPLMFAIHAAVGLILGKRSVAGSSVADSKTGFNRRCHARDGTRHPDHFGLRWSSR